VATRLVVTLPAPVASAPAPGTAAPVDSPGPGLAFAAVRGRVVTEDSTPVASARVALWSLHVAPRMAARDADRCAPILGLVPYEARHAILAEQWPGEILATAVTDALGTFEIRPARPLPREPEGATYRVTARATVGGKTLAG